MVSCCVHAQNIIPFATFQTCRWYRCLGCWSYSGYVVLPTWCIPRNAGDYVPPHPRARGVLGTEHDDDDYYYVGSIGGDLSMYGCFERADGHLLFASVGCHPTPRPSRHDSISPSFSSAPCTSNPMTGSMCLRTWPSWSTLCNVSSMERVLPFRAVTHAF